MISVAPLSATRVLVIVEPHIVSRVLGWRQRESRLAERCDGYWRYVGGAWVGREVEAEIDDAMERSD